MLYFLVYVYWYYQNNIYVKKVTIKEEYKSLMFYQ